MAEEKKDLNEQSGNSENNAVNVPDEAKALSDKSSGAGTAADNKSDEKTLEEKYKRALADYQNLLKQTAKEKMEFSMFANEIMLKEILPVYDHLKMAIEHHNGESAEEWITGVKHVVKQMKAGYQLNGKIIEAAKVVVYKVK